MEKRRIHEPYIFAALAFALTTGFGLAAILIAARASKQPLGAWWIASVQAHGHAQLFGWAGLFVLGVGLFFLPRLRGTTLARVNLTMPALACLVVGIALRTISQPIIPLIPNLAALGRSGVMLSSIFELIGIALIMTMLVSTFRRARPLGPDAPIIPVRPYLVTAFVSLALATILNLALSFSAPEIFQADWDNTLTHLMLMGFIVPMALAMSVRTLPLFMRLATPPKHTLTPILAVYVMGLVLDLVGYLEQPFFSSIGAILESMALLIFTWQLDVLFHRKTPWTAKRPPPPPNYVETRKPPRKNYPDHGEFGRFEWLIMSAYAWLAFACGIAILNGAIVVLGNSPLLTPDVERHAITVGFVTLLIFGMGARMLPGFSGKSRVASTRLVMATFWLGNLAAFFRVMPLLAPDVPGADIALASSGAIDWLAVACLTINLWKTFHQ